jgi:hypothetical protein
LKYLAESLQRPWLWVESVDTARMQVGRDVLGGIFGDVFENERVVAIHAFCI